ncbi:MAG TPA: endonuclease III [Candidatus Thermoplasmatota archaeon]|nr:endonuclease III [Candidatus Thermoplasmatota archaeon]
MPAVRRLVPPLPPGAKPRAPEALARMKREYGETYWFLDFGTPFQLLVAVIMSAQTTDATVNKVTPELFAKFGTPQKLAAAPRQEIERIIFRTGFYRNKAKNIQGAAKHLLERHGGEVPSTMQELLEVPGVARKTANVVMELVAPQNEGICVDTHVGRVARRLALTRAADPVKVEQDLVRLFPRDEWGELPFYFIMHGRSICDAKRPDCPRCFLADICPKKGVVQKP